MNDMVFSNFGPDDRWLTLAATILWVVGHFVVKFW